MSTTNSVFPIKLEIPKPDNTAPDEASKQEEAHFDDDVLSENKRNHERRDLGRKDNFKGIIFWIGVSLAIVASMIGAAAMISLAWHYMAPSHWIYLTDAQVANIKNMLLSAAAGSLAAAFLNHHIHK